VLNQVRTLLTVAANSRVDILCVMGVRQPGCFVIHAVLCRCITVVFACYNLWWWQSEWVQLNLLTLNAGGLASRCVPTGGPEASSKP
jgi:hypothetical protein